MKKIFSEVRSLSEFERDIRKLSRRFRTLPEDLDTFINTQLNLFHKLGKDNKGIFLIPGLDISSPKIYKAKKFACRSLKTKGAASGIRIIYAFYEEEDVIEFIEVYYKGDQENEDRERILRNYQK
ncbi:MAG: hypothetical protein QME66_13125 [Candidatus Eisenbacteria bacterium]|nr:hypothetical protein [Candidatus Eisenbacteria bacterium]